MTTRHGRRKTGGSGPGLFRWGPHGTEQPDEVRDNPLVRACPWCHAAIGESCRTRTRRGWTTCPPHDARKTTKPADQEPPAPPPQTAAQPRTDTR